MARNINPKWLIGRTIVAVDMRPFDSRMDNKTAYDPLITLDNGAQLTFTTQETDTGEYGTAISYHPKPKRRKDAG